MADRDVSLCHGLASGADTTEALVSDWRLGCKYKSGMDLNGKAVVARAVLRTGARTPGWPRGCPEMGLQDVSVGRLP